MARAGAALGMGARLKCWRCMLKQSRICSSCKCFFFNFDVEVQVETNRAECAAAAKGFFKFLRQRLFLSVGGFISS